MVSLGGHSLSILTYQSVVEKLMSPEMLTGTQEKHSFLELNPIIVGMEECSGFAFHGGEMRWASQVE